MTEDRDKRRPRTPPAGVLAQIAPQRPESWEGQRTGVTPVAGVPIGPQSTESPIETLVRRSGQTKNIALDVHGDVAALRGRVEGLEAKVDEHGRQNNTIIAMTGDVIAILKNKSTVETTVTVTEAEIKKTRAMTENEIGRERELALIENMQATNALKREWMKKSFERIALPILVAVTAFIIAYLTKCGR